MDVHPSVNNEKPAFKCAACNKGFFIKSHLGDHLYSHIKGKDLINEICCKGFSEISDLNEYFRNYMLTRAWICDACNATFYFKSDFDKHCSIHIPENPSYVCKQCNKVVDEQENVCAHNHADQTNIFICTFCDKTYFLKRNLFKHHWEFHDIPKPYICTLCNEGFYEELDLKNHCQIHKEMKNFDCEICNKQFLTNYLLEIHLRTHTAERP